MVEKNTKNFGRYVKAWVCPFRLEGMALGLLKLLIRQSAVGAAYSVPFGLFRPDALSPRRRQDRFRPILGRVGVRRINPANLVPAVVYPPGIPAHLLKAAGRNGLT